MDGHGLDGPTWEELAKEQHDRLMKVAVELGQKTERVRTLERSVSHLEAKIENLHQTIRHLVVTLVHDRDG